MAEHRPHDRVTERPGDHPEATALPPGPTRRRVLSAGAIGAAGLCLGGCGSSGSTSTSPSSPAAAGPLATTSQVPVGGAVIVGSASAPVVVSQPTSGQFKAFSAICTHQGCTVGVNGGLHLLCPCHGSQFDAATGAVVPGSFAQLPLPPVAITVNGATITQA